MQDNTVEEAHNIEERLRKKIAEIDSVADKVPGVIIINNLQKNGSVEYMSRRGLEQLGITLEELKEMGEEYHNRYFNPDDAKEYVPKVLELLARNDENETFSFFQQVKKAPNSTDYIWHMSTLKIFMRNNAGEPIFAITFSAPIDPTHELTQKVWRLLDQNNFLRTHYQYFARLGRREREILKLIALGKSTADIAAELFIAIGTVETHRKNIRKKLNISSAYEVSQYAHAFNLLW